MIPGTPPLDLKKENTIYYLAEDPQTGTLFFIFSEFDHIFRNRRGYITGKSYYVSNNEFTKHLARLHKRKLLGEVELINMGYTKQNDSCYLLNSDSNIKDSIETRFPHIFEPAYHPLSCTLSTISEQYIIGYFEPRNSLKRLRINNSSYNTIFETIMKNLNLNEDQLGITGSLGLGCMDANDIDIVFYGNTNQLLKIREYINECKQRYGVITEYGLNWPMRFFMDARKSSGLFCSFFNNISTNYLPKIYQQGDLKNKTYFEATIIGDAYSCMKSPVLFTNNEDESIWIFDTVAKGVIKKGDIIKGYGSKIKIPSNSSKIKSTIIIIDPFKHIDDFEGYYN